ncbi:MAG: hypothetical protein F6K19_30920 [Cyanothece sp. SIO1E1]|nr:hypothetical protein [Cyanothece sp. SIO1E1]
MKYFTLLILYLLLSSFTHQISAQTPPPKIKVYLLGTFHFSQTDSTYNVLDEKHQQSIHELCQIIAKQQPDKVFIERQPEYEFQNKIDSLFTLFSKMKSRKLRVKNELVQVGFRVAKMLGHKKVYQCDHPGRYGSLYNNSLQYAQANNQMGYLDATVRGTAVRADDLVNEDSLMQSSTLLEYIQWINSDAVMNTSHAGYVSNYPLVGSKGFYNYEDDDTLIGAELTADWYRRNIMIYTKMISQLTFDEKAIFLIMGGDHIPILKHLFESNPSFEVMNAESWLK